jgi:hypothetical protein
LCPFAAIKAFGCRGRKRRRATWNAEVLIDRRRTEALHANQQAVVRSDLVVGPYFFRDQLRPGINMGAHPFQSMINDWEQHGFHIAHRFCGERFMRGETANSQCELILEPVHAERDATPAMRGSTPPR